jgi:hypothetical protein
MDIQVAYLYLTDKLNKLSTNFNQNLPPHVAVRAINEAQYYWLDERLKVEEMNKTIQRELQFLLVKQEPVLFADDPLYTEYTLPANYYHPSLLDVTVRTPDCTFNVENDFIENANVNTFLADEMTKPDYKWEQIFSTFRDNKLAIYKDTTPDYTIDKVVFHYYRKPAQVDIASGHKNVDGLFAVDVDLEFPESSCYEILDIAAKIIAGSTNDQARVQYNHQLTQEYK